MENTKMIVSSLSKDTLDYTKEENLPLDSFKIPPSPNMAPLDLNFLFDFIPTSPAQWKVFAHSLNSYLMQGGDVKPFQSALTDFLSSNAHLNNAQRLLSAITQDIEDNSEEVYSSIIFDCIFSNPHYSHESMIIEMSLSQPYVFKIFYALVGAAFHLQSEQSIERKNKHKNLYNLCVSLSQNAPVPAKLEFDQRRAIEGLSNEIKRLSLKQGPFAPLIIEFYKNNPDHLIGQNSRGFDAYSYWADSLLAMVKEAIAKKPKTKSPKSYVEAKITDFASAKKVIPHINSNVNSGAASLSPTIKRLTFFKKMLHWLAFNAFINTELENVQLTQTRSAISNTNESISQGKDAAYNSKNDTLTSSMGDNYISCFSAINSLGKVYFSQKENLSLLASKALQEYMNLFLIVENQLTNALNSNSQSPSSISSIDTPSQVSTGNPAASVEPSIIFYLKKQFPVNFLTSIDAFVKISQACSQESDLLEASSMLTSNLNLMIEKTARYTQALQSATSQNAITELKVEHKYLKSSM